MIYLDNAATTFPKPHSVVKAVDDAVKIYGGNPGRSGHKLSLNAAEKIFETRRKAAVLFGAQPENVVFTLNCTHALNIAIKGLAEKGSRVITTELEHNSVLRPLYALVSEKGISRETVKVHNKSDDEIISLFEDKINNKTSLIISTHASNVTGQIMPIRKIYQIAKRYSIPFIVDAAQTAGIFDIKIKRDADIICCAGHKGLYGPTGTGLMVLGDILPHPLTYGGTGNKSLKLNSPPYPPERYESGTVNTVGILGLNAGIDYVGKITTENIYAHEKQLCDTVIKSLSKNDKIVLYTKDTDRAPIVLFNFKNISAPLGAELLSDRGFALRGGLHCAPLAHKALNTLPQGAIRFSPSRFNTQNDILSFCETVNNISCAK